MNRAAFLKELGIDRWRLRGAGPEAPAEAAPITAAAAVPAPAREDDMAKRGRPRKEVAPPPPLPVLPPLDLPKDWVGLKAMVEDCLRCKLCDRRTQTVFGTGVEDAPLMIVGEAPGEEEDAHGEPFIGRAGKLLDEMLKAIGRSRKKNVYIANVIKCRPPMNREPEPDEVEACRPYLDQQIALVKPKLIVALGRTAAQRLLGTQEPLSRLRGPMFTYGADKTPVLVSYHPAYLLRSPKEKAKSWEDLKKIHRLLEAPA